MVKTIIIDDEPLALQLMEGYVIKTPGLELTGKFDSPLDALDFLNNNKVDLIFLDIQMPDLNGIEFARSLETGQKIIFTTAYPNYAVEGFRLNAIDYLLKPFSYEEFLKGVNKAIKLMKLERNILYNVESNNEFLFLKSEYKIKRINFNDILYIEGLKDYIKVFVQNDPKPVLSPSIS